MTPGVPATTASADGQRLASTAMLFRGTEEYGIGTIAKLYASAAPSVLFVCSREGPLTRWLRDGGYRLRVVPELIHRLGMGPGFGRLRLLGSARRARAAARRLAPMLRAEGVEVVQANWYPHYLVAGFLRRHGFRAVWQINNYLSPGRFARLRRTAHERIAEWGADLLLPASDFISAEWSGTRTPRCTVRNAALDVLPDPRPEPPEGPPFRCVVAGRMTAEKGHHVAIEAVLAARAEGHDVRLDVCGGPLEDNAYADGLRRRIDAAGEAAAVRLLGFVDDLRQRHPEYHLGFQCRIDPEPCSLWVCEAGLDGLPLLASASGGTPELIEEGANGFLVPPGDAPALARRLGELLRHPPRLAELRRSTLETGRRRFRAERFVADTARAFAGHLGAAGTAR